MGWMMLDGKLLEEKEAKISVWDHGFLYGMGCFETLRLYQGHPFLLWDHLDRLHQGLKRLNISPPYGAEEWLEQIVRLAEKTGFANASVRIMVTGGEEGPGLHARAYKRPHALLFIRPYAVDDEKRFRTGKRLVTVSTPRQAPGGVEHFKTNNYLNSILARQELSNFPDEEGMMLTPEGKIAEGIVSNLFFVRKGVLHTPSLKMGILAGITRKWVLALARYLGIPAEEGVYTLQDWREADEWFLTNSLQEIVPITEWEGERRQRFPIAAELVQEYRKHTRTLLSIHEWFRGKV